MGSRAIYYFVDPGCDAGLAWESVSNRSAGVFQTTGLAGLLATAMVLAWTSLKLPFICPLRAMTGVPCPLCGMTTGTVAFLRGDLSGSLAAAPLSVVVVPATVAGLAVRLRTLGKASKLPSMSAGLRRAGLVFLGLALIFSWMFQLHRFGVI